MSEKQEPFDVGVILPFPAAAISPREEGLIATIMEESAIEQRKFDEWIADEGDLLMVRALEAAGDYNDAGLILVAALRLLDESELRQKANRILGPARGAPPPAPEAA